MNRFSSAKSTIRWVLTALCLAYVAYYLAHNSSTLEVLGNVKLDIAIYLTLLNLPFLMFQAARYLVVLRHCSGHALAYLAWFRIFMVGRFLNAIFPQAGNLYRGYVLKASHGISYTDYISGFLAFSWLGTVFSMVAAFVILFFGSRPVDVSGVDGRIWVGAIALGVTAGPFALYEAVKILHFETRIFLRITRKIEEILRAVLLVAANIRYLGGFLALSAVLLVVSYLMFFLSFAALHVGASPQQILLLYVLLQLFNFVALTPGNIGVQEIAFGVLGQQIGSGGRGDFSVSALIRAAGYSALFAVAVPMGAFGELKSWRKSQ